MNLFLLALPSLASCGGNVARKHVCCDSAGQQEQTLYTRSNLLEANIYWSSTTGQLDIQ